MSRHTTEELIARWRGERITTEQVIGQLLLTVQELEQRLRVLERRETPPPTPPPPAAPPSKRRG